MISFQSVGNKLKMTAVLILATIALAIFFYANNPFKKMFLSSEVKGRLISMGAPLVGATIERELRWSWKDLTLVDRVTSDSSGEFTLAPVWKRSILGGLLPHQPNIRQTITAIHEGKKYNLWMFDKGDYENLSEFKGKEINLKCSTEKEPVRNEEFDSFGICEIELRK